MDHTQEQFDLDWQHAIEQEKLRTVNAAEVSKQDQWQKFIKRFQKD
jgi:hypothetical protein